MSITNERAFEEAIELSLITSGGYTTFGIRHLEFGIQNKQRKNRPVCVRRTGRHRQGWDKL